MIFRGDSYDTWEKHRANDKPIVCAIAQELKRHAIVITHYGTGFDIPFLRAKMVKYNLDPLPPMFAVDSYYIARSNFQISSRRLANLGTYFDLGEKSGVEGALWMRAAYDGDKKADADFPSVFTSDWCGEWKIEEDGSWKKGKKKKNKEVNNEKKGDTTQAPT